MSACLSAYLSVCLSIYLSIYLSTYLSRVHGRPNHSIRSPWNVKGNSVTNVNVQVTKFDTIETIWSQKFKTQLCLESGPKNVRKLTPKRTKNGLRGLPGASPGPPRGLPGASRGHFREHATQREKTRKNKSLSGPHFTYSGGVPETPGGPQNRPGVASGAEKKWKTSFFMLSRWGSSF